MTLVGPPTLECPLQSIPGRASRACFLIKPDSAFLVSKAVLCSVRCGSTNSDSGGPHTFDLTHHDYMLSGDGPQEAAQKKEVWSEVYCPVRWDEEVGKFYEDLTTQLVDISSEKLHGDLFQLDAIRE